MEEDLPLRSMSADTDVIRRDICRMQLSAEGFADSDADHVTIDIKDQNGDVRDSLTLAAENGWTTVWEALDSGDDSFTVEETGIYDSSGRDLSEEWDCSVQTSEEQTSVKTYDGWEYRENFDNGIYVIEFESNGNSYLLASNEYVTRPTKCWLLVADSSQREFAPMAARWDVTTQNTGFLIRNQACSTRGYLAAFNAGSYGLFAILDTSDKPKSYYENGYLKSSAWAAGWRYLKATENEISCVQEDENPTKFSLYRLVTIEDMIHESSATFCHAQKPPPVQYTTVTVKLTVGGNMREWDRAFPFTAAVNDEDPVSFTLMHAEEFELEDIPIGAKLRVNMLAPDYEVTSAFGDNVEGESSLTLSSVPEGGGTVVFQAIRDWELRTGISPGRRNSNSLVLTVILSGFALYPFISIQIQHRIIPTITRRKYRS